MMRVRDKFRIFLTQEDINVDLIYQTMTTKMSFLFFTPERNKEIGIMFEVINNRGKALSELEKIKNFFIYYATVHERANLRNDINHKWSNIILSLSEANRKSNEDENAFLRSCFVVFFDTSKEKSWNVYGECKLVFEVNKYDDDYIHESVETMRFFVDFLTCAARHHSWFFNANRFETAYKNEYKQELRACLTYLRCQPANASIMPIYLSIMARLDVLFQVVRLLQ